MAAAWPQPPISVRKVLITGGAGFIGSTLIEEIIRQFPHLEVVCLDALTYAGNRANLESFASCENFKFIQTDLRDAQGTFEALKEESPDWVFHLAAETHVDRSIQHPADAVSTNVVGTLNLLEACRAAWGSNSGERRFIHVSTDEVFGSIENGANSELSRYDPSSPYSASKAGSDHLVRAYVRTYGFPAMITWCTNNYGPRQFPEKLIPLMIFNALEGRKLPVYGDGLHSRDWLFAADHAEGLWRAAISGQIGEGYCFGGGEQLTNLQIVKEIVRLAAAHAHSSEAGMEGLIEFVADRPGHDRRYALDSSKARENLQWTPQTAFQEGFSKTFTWYLQNRSWLEAVKSPQYDQWIKVNYQNRGQVQA